MQPDAPRIREIPYNYTSYTDREIVLRLLGAESWERLDRLRAQRRTGQSARMLMEILGDIWVVVRNPYLFDDLLDNPKRRAEMQSLHSDRLNRIQTGAHDNEDVTALLAAAHTSVARFHNAFRQTQAQRVKALRVLARHTKKHNIHFDPYARVSHVTDATDWRVEYPFVVVTPNSEFEISGLIRAAKELDLVVIPRGGGTGLTGGAVPLHPNTMVINTEKLDHIGEVATHTIESGDLAGRVIHTITAESGAVNGRVTEAAKKTGGLIFATDPTSLWACTIGGNIATNAGGKKAVMWGTCLDNLLRYRLVTADGGFMEVVRLDHNMARIPADGIATFRITRFECDGVTQRGQAEILTLPGSIFRKEGLGKDVTNKPLGGLPGIQKEGTDGLITQATFVLHEPFNHTRTVLLEFFPIDLTEPVQAIVEIKDYVATIEGIHLTALEHFDEKYVKAIGYKTKSRRGKPPRMGLIIDVGGNDEGAVAKACDAMVALANRRDGEGFVAVGQEARNLFWADRGRMSRIAAHTKAFKINEDVVIPLPRLTEYADYVERLNIELSTHNKVDIAAGLVALFERLRLDLTDDDQLTDLPEQDGYLLEKLAECTALAEQVRDVWQNVLDVLDVPANVHPDLVRNLAAMTGQEGIPQAGSEPLFRLIQRGEIRISYRKSLETPLLEIIDGWREVADRIKANHGAILRGRVVIATHVHAGDGNVHTNIPLNSDHAEMMRTAHKVVEKIMAKAEALDGVISGEHGIGLTKLDYLGGDIKQAMVAYKKTIDPDDRFNRGKLVPGTDLTFAYTPSFSLLEHEALLMKAADLEELSESISDCLRCGKCKPVCHTHHPRGNMLFAPRNKILATGLIIETFLYEAQTQRGISFQNFEMLEEVADHCTVCHSCEKPCPVDIDFGDVTQKLRDLLRAKGKASLRPMKKLAMAFLLAKQPGTVNAMRLGMMRIGMKAQRTVSLWLKGLGVIQKQDHRKFAPTGQGIQSQVIRFMERPMPSVPAQTMRASLGIEDRNTVPILRDVAKDEETMESVFYFPGCGSEKLFSNVGLASLAMLHHAGVRTVLPPGYLCCGYPSRTAGDAPESDRITYENRVLFHRMATALSYLDIKTVVVSCGTCFDQLMIYEMEKIFPGCRIVDIHELLLERGYGGLGVAGRQYMYHEPCHTPLKHHGAQKTLATLIGEGVSHPERCCGEAGTLAVTRPDIAAKIRHRKEEEIEAIPIQSGDRKILTTCPACLQGLSRLADETGAEAEYVVTEMAATVLGKGWEQRFVNHVLNKGGIERVLL